MLDYREWEKTVPTCIRRDALWSEHVYRLALFVADTGWEDVATLTRDRRTMSTVDQLVRALGSISANIAEGYSRGSGRDRCRFYEYALGSARESRDWYYKLRHVLGSELIEHRLNILTEVIRLLLAIIPKERSLRVGEPEAVYDVAAEPVELSLDGG
ncbi:MAG: four helix bundle protein [Armatimonadota bacterium]